MQRGRCTTCFDCRGYQVLFGRVPFLLPDDLTGLVFVLHSPPMIYAEWWIEATVA